MPLASFFYFLVLENYQLCQVFYFQDIENRKLIRFINL